MGLRRKGGRRWGKRGKELSCKANKHVLMTWTNIDDLNTKTQNVCRRRSRNEHKKIKSVGNIQQQLNEGIWNRILSFQSKSLRAESAGHHKKEIRNGTVTKTYHYTIWDLNTILDLITIWDKIYSNVISQKFHWEHQTGQPKQLT